MKNIENIQNLIKQYTYKPQATSKLLKSWLTRRRIDWLVKKTFLKIYT